MIGFVLDLRSAPRGGAVVPARLTPPSPTLDTLRRCTDIVFLVHGFNVDRADGTVELGAFGAQLTALGPGAAVAVLWPGDSIIGPLSYPFETSKADDSAVELATFIGDNLPQRPRISFIGHSLGCRVVMETVRQLWIMNVPVAQVCLMAAAIDNDSLAIPGNIGMPPRTWRVSACSIPRATPCSNMPIRSARCSRISCTGHHRAMPHSVIRVRAPPAVT